MDQVISNNVDGYVVCDLKLNVISSNPKSLQLLRVENTQQLGERLASLFQHHSRHSQAELLTFAQGNMPFQTELYDGIAEKWFDAILYPQTKQFTLCIKDITEYKHLFQSLEESELRFKTMLESVVDGVILIDEEGTITLCNSVIQDLFGYHPSELIGRNVSILMSDDNKANHDSYIKNHLNTGATKIIGVGREVEGLRNDMSTFTLELGVSKFTLHGRNYFVGTMRDVTERKKNEKFIKKRNAKLEEKIERKEKQLKSINRRLEKLAMHDHLTGLPNRTLFQEKLRSGIKSADITDQSLILLILDLDNFKEINDTLGHNVGDKLLKQVSERITTLLRTGDTIARLGGDEFGVILMRVTSEGAKTVAQSILDELEPPFTIDSHTLSIKASIGIAVYREHGDNDAILMKNADVAMYEAKHCNQDYAFYDPENDPHTPDRLGLLPQLRLAIKNDDLQLFFQPKIDLVTGRSTDVEALLRWHHAEKGMIPPDVFIPVAEQAGLIKPLTYWVIDTAIKQYARWAKQKLNISIAVNLSAKNLDDDDLPAYIANKLEKWAMPPENLVLELTETSIISDPAQALKILTRLDDMGITISIDDYGTGFSSLAYVKKLPVDEIKIDRSFVANIISDKDDAVIVKSTINLAHDLGMRTVAEGVEDQATLELLRSLNCDCAQGYYFSRPLPVDQATAWFMQYANEKKTETV